MFQLVSLRSIAWLALLMLSGFSQCAAADAYRLGPRDQIHLRILEWRAARGEAFDWKGLAGEYTVDAAGNLSLPLLGQVAANGKTVDELAARISGLLQSRIGLAQRPEASVEISSYRPFYVSGGVEHPGEYPYHPDLRVREAVSLAGGYYRLHDAGLARFERDAIVARGDLRVLTDEEFALRAREARLVAESQDSASINFPQQLIEKKSDPLLSKMLDEESLLFKTRRDGLRSQSDSFDQLKVLLQSEIETMRAKITTQDRQANLIRQELEKMAGLASRGLALVPHSLELQQSVTQLESNKLDLQLSILRAQQDMSKADRDKLELINKRRQDVLAELAETRSKLASAQQKMQTARNLIYESEVTAPARLSARNEARQVAPTFEILRGAGSNLQEIAAQENDPMEPGDTLKVVLPHADETEKRAMGFERQADPAGAATYAQTK